MAHRYDLVIVGMGSAGMTAAEFATRLGLTVLVVERGRVGGDCLWTGCVPSKALIASAKAAHTMRHANRLGLTTVEPDIDTGRVWARVRAVQRDIAGSDDDPERFRDRGVEIVHGHARLTGPNTVEVDGAPVQTRFTLVCTGSRPTVPDLPGLSGAGFVTNENLFELDRAPSSVVTIGGGPLAVEMAQALTRLGVRTTVLQRGPTILPRDEPTLVAVLHGRLSDEGVDVRTGVRTEVVEVVGGHKVVHGKVDGDGRLQRWEADEVLVAAGRTPNVDGLGAEEVGVRVGPRGIEVDDRLRTSVPTISAAGDVAGPHRFSHAAAYEAVVAVRNMFLPRPLRRRAPCLVPWCTFTDPELAHAGMTVAEAERAHGDSVEVWRHDLGHSDRARVEATTDGAIVIVTHRRRVVGAHVLAPAAGEVVHELALAARHRMRMADLSALVHVYPTIATGVGQLAADAVYDRAARLRWWVAAQRPRAT